MTQDHADTILAAEVVLPGSHLDDTLRLFTERLGFRVESIYPADAPVVAVLRGHGLRLRLDGTAAGGAGTLRLRCRNPAAVAGGQRELLAPNGTRIVLVEDAAALVLPPLQPSFVVSRLAGDAPFHLGRAGMRYRDLIPGRQGGRFIASHIQIPDGGPVPDYVHFHKIRFQMIYCYKGWVRVVYEDQGPPFVLQAGDCVLQPPQIRHRVLESSPGLEVIELGCPAEHETCADLELQLPTATLAPQREFGGQRFVRHIAAGAPWGPWRRGGFDYRDFGIAAATCGLAGVGVVRRHGAADERRFCHAAELVFLFVLSGAMTVRADGQPEQRLQAGDCCVIPAALGHALAACSADLELLEVTLPAAVATTPAA